MMDVIEVLIELVIGMIAWKTCGIDFPTICFFINISIRLYKGFKKILKITIRFFKSTPD